MNGAESDFDWNQVRAFLATVEEGSLSAAARVLKLTQPTVGRQVSALEERLGVPLFERVGKSLELTPSGQELAEHVREMGAAAARLSLAASGQVQSVEGIVKITATEMASAFVLPAVVKELRESHPGLVLEIIATNSLSDLRRREADIAVRNTEPKDLDLIGKRVRSDHGGLFASESLVAEYGPFRTMADLRDVPMIGIGDDDGVIDALQGIGAPVSVSQVVVRSRSHLVHHELTCRGLGIGVNNVTIGESTPGLVRILPDDVDFEYPIWLVAPRELKTSRRVRIVFDTLARHLGKTGDEARAASLWTASAIA